MVSLGIRSIPAVYGHSSGAALVAVAAGWGLPFTHVVLHEPPYGPDDVDTEDEGAQVLEETDRLVEAVELPAVRVHQRLCQAISQVA